MPSWVGKIPKPTPLVPASGGSLLPVSGPLVHGEDDLIVSVEETRQPIVAKE